MAASATTLQVRFLVDDVGDARAKQRVVVDDEHAGALAPPPAKAVDGPVSASDMSLAGIEKDGGSQASTTSVPARGAVTIVSDAPIRSARSCMLVMPKPVPRCSFAIPRPSSATDSRNPSDRTAEA